MDSVAKPPPKPSNISEIVFKFAKVCRLRSIGVFSSDINTNITENSSEATEEAENVGKVHSYLLKIHSKSNQFAEVEISKLFDTISAMKLAYIQLQEAHIPYDPDKIKAANELVVAQFGEIYKIKHAYKKLKDKNSSSHLSAVLLHEIQVQEKLLEKLNFQVTGKNMELINLQRELEDLNLLNTEMAGKLEKKEKENIKNLDVSSFGDIFADASVAIHDFAKPLISLMKASGWDLDQAVNSIESSVFYSKRSHKKYAFEAYISRKMFQNLTSHLCDLECIMKCNDPIGALIEYPFSDFAKFCRNKYLYLIHPMMEASFFGNLDNRTLVLNGNHPRTPFYEAFVKMAWRVWVLIQRIAFSSEIKAEIYGVKRGNEFSDAYMENVFDIDEEMVNSSERRKYQVEFMVMPGFKIGNILVKSRVYLSELRS